MKAILTNVCTKKIIRENKTTEEKSISLQTVFPPFHFVLPFRKTASTFRGIVKVGPYSLLLNYKWKKITHCHARQLLVGFLMMCISIWNVSLKYCKNINVKVVGQMGILLFTFFVSYQFCKRVIPYFFTKNHPLTINFLIDWHLRCTSLSSGLCL